MLFARKFEEEIEVQIVGWWINYDVEGSRNDTGLVGQIQRDILFVLRLYRARDETDLTGDPKFRTVFWERARKPPPPITEWPIWRIFPSPTRNHAPKKAHRILQGRLRILLTNIYSPGRTHRSNNFSRKRNQVTWISK